MIDMNNYMKVRQGNDWQEKFSFEHGTLFQGLIILNKCKTILEIGVSTARTTKLLCQAAQINGGIVYGYDLWDIHGVNNQFPASSTKEKSAQYLTSAGFTNFEFTTINTKTPEFHKLIKTKHPKIDFAFIDGCHSYDGVLNDFNAVYKNLSETGIIAFHDTAKIDGSREFNIDLRTKFFDGTFDVVDFPFGSGNYNVGVSLLVKRSYAVLGDKNKIIEQCNPVNNYDEIYKKEQDWYNEELRLANERRNNN